MRRTLVPAVVLSSVLAACGQTTPGVQGAADSAVAAYAARPELQDAGSQAILARYGNDPGLLASLQEAYGERPAALTLPQVPALTGLDYASDRLAYIKRVGWGSVSNYNSQYNAYAGTSSPYTGLDWSRDGCSAPDGLGLGYREDFRPACNVHDFAYRNLKVYERTEANRKTSDEAFHTNMKSICAAKSWYARPACYSAAYAYYQAVRLGGSGSF
ncbi:phospholipase A2 [Deinococcus multiflagellatus]|uniref:Phospholipase A2 n=1 Tax=Deinococcus multiflagellatus TaxID=1656887 RepID=A0ABW1ZKH6_9DEIO|nr:phospholipase A2 [Deinococcus multiflagellatus]MBZ9714245.1 phospholipase [Deinococcus multiflagellatus]